jgi:rare lipoprotein A
VSAAVKSNRPSVPRAAGTIAAGLLSAVYLYSCAARPEAPPPPLPAVTKPARGPSATPTPTSHLLEASWYGPGMAGRKTSNGERFDPRGLTAASKTIPLGSVIRVTNPQNGKSVKVRINDRGPFVPGRSLDLSRHAAEKIGIIRKGVARVKVTRAQPPIHTSARRDADPVP